VLGMDTYIPLTPLLHVKNTTQKGSKKRKLEYDDNTKYKYDEIIDVLIKGQKIRHDDPCADLCLVMKKNVLGEDSELRRILLSMYDIIIEKNNAYEKSIKEIKRANKYDQIQIIDSKTVGENDPLFDTDYEYHQIKKN